MKEKSLIDFHHMNWYNAAGIAFSDIQPHIQNFKRVDEIVPPGPRFYLVVNLNTYKYEYVGKGQRFLTGYSNEQVSREGISFQLANLHPEDGEYIVKRSYPRFTEILSGFSPEGQKNILLQNNYRFRHKEGHYVHLIEQNWVMETDEKGAPQLMLTHVYQLPMIHPFRVNVIIKELLPDQSYEVLYATEFPEPEEKVSLSQREAEVMSLLAEGLNSEGIGQRLSISFHTVRTHRKNMLKKLGMKSTNELIAYGISHGIIR